MNCLTYRQLVSALERTNRKAHLLWKEGEFNLFKKYSLLSGRIVQAMDKYDTNRLITNN